MPEWVSQFVEVLKTVAPWLTGGLAGAILTYLLNQRAQRKKLPRLDAHMERINYSLPTHDEEFKDLRVFYGGQAFESLLYAQLSVQNVSARSVTATPFLINLPANADLVDRSSVIRPVNRRAHWEPQAEEAGAFLWNPGELKPGDSARLRLLVSPAGTVEWSFRGDDDVEVSSYDRESANSFEADLRFGILWFALFVATGTIPLIGGFFQALWLIASAPLIIRYAQRWRRVLTSKRWRTPAAPPIVIGGTDSNIAVSYDAVLGSSSISIRNADPEE